MAVQDSYSGSPGAQNDPSFTFVQEPNTGMFLESPGVLAFTVQGLVVFRLRAGQAYTLSGVAGEDTLATYGNSIAAAVAANGATHNDVIIFTGTTVTGTVTVPSTLRLRVRGNGSITVADGAVLNIDSDFDAPARPIFVLVGTGKVYLRGANPIIYPEWFGARFDDTTDDKTAIQAAIDSVGSTAQTRRSGATIRISGPAAISNTITISGKSIILEGTGWGLRPTSGIERNDSWLRWIGAAGGVMLRLQNTFGAMTVRRLRFIGDPLNVCASAISIYQVLNAAGNTHNSLEEILIGQHSGEIISPATTFDYGIKCEGTTSQNNDSWHFRQIYISGATVGFHTGSGQHLAHHLDRVTITNATVGIELAGGEIIGDSVFLSAISDAGIRFFTPDDFGNVSNPRAFFNWLSFEGCNRMADMQSASTFSVLGGYFQLTSSMSADGKVIKTGNNNTQSVALREYRFSQSTSPPTAPFLELAGAGGGSHKTLTLDNVAGMSLMTGGVNGIDAPTIANSDRRTIFYNPSNYTTGLYAPFNMASYQGVSQFDPFAMDVTGSLNFQTVTKSQITGDVHNYDLGAGTYFRVTLDAPHDMSGILASTGRSRFIILVNDSANALSILHESGSSTAANRIYTSTGATLSLAANDSVILIYDTTETRWRVLNIS